MKVMGALVLLLVAAALGFSQTYQGGFRFDSYDVKKSSADFLEKFNREKKQYQRLEVALFPGSFFLGQISDGEYGYFIDAVWVRYRGALFSVCYTDINREKDQMMRGNELRFDEVKIFGEDEFQLTGTLNDQKKVFVINMKNQKVKN